MGKIIISNDGLMNIIDLLMLFTVFIMIVLIGWSLCLGNFAL